MNETPNIFRTVMVKHIIKHWDTFQHRYDSSKGTTDQWLSSLTNRELMSVVG